MSYSYRNLPGKAELFADKRGRPKKQPPSDTRLKMVFPWKVYKEWREMEKRMIVSYSRTFTRAERLIFFCRIVCKWGRPKIARATGLSQRQVWEFTAKIKEM